MYLQESNPYPHNYPTRNVSKSGLQGTRPTKNRGFEGVSTKSVAVHAMVLFSIVRTLCQFQQKHRSKDSAFVSFLPVHPHKHHFFQNFLRSSPLKHLYKLRCYPHTSCKLNNPRVFHGKKKQAQWPYHLKMFRAPAKVGATDPVVVSRVKTKTPLYRG